MGFNFFQISAQNQNGLAFGFTQKHRFATKTNRNNEFLRRKAQNLDRLRIMLMHISFYVFKKIKFQLKIQRG
jgi:histidinol phosphatase-like enzyme